MTGGISLHAVDVANGVPAAGMRVEILAPPRGASRRRSFRKVAVFRFTVGDLQEHYHLPLKFTAWGFALFRGA